MKSWGDGVTLGFSYIGLIWLIALFVPNIIWIKSKPKGYESLKKEDRILGILERIGEVGVTMISPIYREFNPHGMSPRLLWLTASAVCMILYEVWWIRYFKSEKRLEDFYSGLFGIPVAGAVLPVAAFALLAVYGRNTHLALFVVPLAIGHIGIHLNHLKEIKADKESEE